jgi:CDP-diglyceride synthetase
VAKRIFSTVVLWAIVGGALWFFRTAGALVLITLISVLTLREFYQMMHASGYQPFDKLGMFVGALITLAPWWVGAQFGKPVHLLLQCAYAEMIFSPVLWPDFTKAELAAAVEEYQRRERRFGLTGEQLHAGTVPAAPAAAT